MNTEPINRSSIQLTPVGVVRSAIKTPMLRAGDSDLSLTERMEKIKAEYLQNQNLVSELVIDPCWEALLDGIEGFSHILVLYWPHLLDPARRQLKKVHPMGRQDLPIQGIFATCSPARPNPVLVSAVPLISREKNILKVKGLEAVDGSPILDLKPYTQGYMQKNAIRMPDWMAQIHRELTAE
jgi:tRNA (adenine37-N6)-methyltransferase